jgi:D-methionine transport system ATP-binding protein
VASTSGSDGHLLRLTYYGPVTEEPVLSRICRESGLDFAILQGSVGRLKGVPYGRLIVRISAVGQERLQTLVQALGAHGIRHEVLT